MRRGRYTLYGLALAVACHHAIAEEASAEYLLREVESRGEAVVLDQEYSNDAEWAHLIREVGRGADGWLRLASILYRVSDAGVSEELAAAVGEALATRPASVFRIAYPAFSPSQVCGSPDMNDHRFNSYRKALTAIDLRITAVAKIREKVLLDARDQCLDALRVSRAELQARLTK